jgi:hypothetical protein
VSGSALRRRRLLQAGAAAALLCAVAGVRAQRAPQGVALLVGNTSYNPGDEDLPPSRKCVDDLDRRLQRLGFSTVALHDPPMAQVQAELEKLQRAIAGNPALGGVFYFVGHGFQSNAENFLVPAGGNLQSAPATLAKSSVSLEREVFTRLKRPAGPAATVILVDACRTPDRPRTPGEGTNQTMPPEGCHVVFSTGPGKRAFAPADPARYTLFTEVLVGELDQVTDPLRSIYGTLEAVRAKVTRKVNGVAAIVKAFGPNAQQPEIASNVRGDPGWLPAPPAAARPAPPPVQQKADAAQAQGGAEESLEKLRALRATLPEGDEADLVATRIADLERVLAAARAARLALDPGAVPAGFDEDAQRAFRGDKYAALRIAESLPAPAAGGDLIERTPHGRWMIYAALLGNGIAAYRLSLFFRNVDRRDAEAARYLALARSHGYTPPTQLTQGR